MRVPQAFVRHALRWILEARHCRRGYRDPRKQRQRRGDRHVRGLQYAGPVPVGSSRGDCRPHDGRRPDASVLELGVQWRIHLHLDIQEGHQEAVEPGVAGQGARGLLAHPGFWRPARGLHGVLQGSGYPEGLPPMVYRLHSGGFGRPAPHYDSRLIGGHASRDPVVWCRLPSRRGFPQERNWYRSLAGQPRTQPWDFLAGWRSSLQGSLR